MEQVQKFPLKLETLKTAFADFSGLLKVDLNGFPEIIVDGIRNGHIQKFEFCIELLWKTVKIYLLEVEKIATTSPSNTIKEFYSTGIINDAEYETVMDMLEDRNLMSHLYREQLFKQVHSRLPKYEQTLQKIIQKLESKMSVPEN